eukprot:TRINITY_DN1037_c0_g3_i2.p1 TRINITY_DN1037_c0_g3~~TRINITY_DN1037_c0_g3_i2.p1  ORF type:complete len:170 (-),score=57.29 TRINITY_DN1037_c0_g3_i2:186-695(-)
MKMKNYSQAIVHCNEVLKNKPENIKALYRRGMSHLAMDELEKAKDDFEEGMELYPEDVDFKKAMEQLRAREIQVKQRQKKVSSKILEELNYAQSCEEEEKLKKKRKEEELKKANTDLKKEVLRCKKLREVLKSWKAKLFGLCARRKKVNDESDISSKKDNQNKYYSRAQ